MNDTPDIAALVARVLVRERAAIALALNLTEDRRPAARANLKELLARLHHSGASERAHRIGITGPPGVGKSTLVCALIHEIRAAARMGSADAPVARPSVGILAIDPSSHHSGGALLGDRLRIAPDPSDVGVFVRSLATAGELGGLAPSVAAAVLVLSAAFDVVLVETVGVGQTETEVRHVVDSLAFVVQPGAGDALQFLKAGAMEGLDLIVVNKGDQKELAQRAMADLRSAFGVLDEVGVGARTELPILATSARDKTGISDLWKALQRHREELGETGALTSQRRLGAIALASRAFARRHGEAGIESVGGMAALQTALAARLDRGEDIISSPKLAGAAPGAV